MKETAAPPVSRPVQAADTGKGTVGYGTEYYLFQSGKSCEKQYMPEESENFARLAAFFRSAAQPAENPDIDQILALIEQDLSSGFPEGKRRLF